MNTQQTQPGTTLTSDEPQPTTTYRSLDDEIEDLINTQHSGNNNAAPTTTTTTTTIANTQQINNQFDLINSYFSVR